MRQCAKGISILTTLLSSASVPFIAAPAFAQSASATPAELAEIVVTAQKREQSMQDVGLAVAAVGQAALKVVGTGDNTALAKAVPSLQIASYSPASTVFNIRGISQNDFSDLQEAPIAFYNDEVYIGAAGAIAGQMFDVQRIEVLRGPQGTLFGRNATGGLVQVVPNRPTQDFSGYGQVTIGQYGQRDFEGAVSGSITDGIRARLSGIRQFNHGYIKNLAGGPNWNATDFWALRGQLEFDLSPDDKLRLTAQYLRNDHERSNPDYGKGAYVPLAADSRGVGIGPNDNIFGPGGYYANITGIVPNAAAGPGSNFFGYVPPSDPYSANDDFAGQINRKYQSYTARYEHDFGGVTFTAIGNYQRLQRLTSSDYDATPQPIAQGGIYIDYKQYSGEARFSGNTDQLNWVAGLYYMNIRHDATSDVFIALPVVEYLNGLPTGFLDQNVLYTAHQKTRSLAPFGQLEYKVSDAFKIIGGLRYTNDKKSYNFVGFNDYVNPPLSFSASPYNYNAQPGAITDRTFQNWSGKLQVEFRPSVGTLFYAGVNRGTKAGGFNAPNAFPTPGVDSPATVAAYTSRMTYNQEVLMNYEAGFKLAFDHKRVNLNGSLFRYVYSNYQSFSNANNISSISNYDARVLGAELELAYRPTRAFTATAYVTHMFQRKIKNYVVSPTLTLDTLLPFDPAWTVGLQGSYEYELGNIGSLTLATNWKYNSSQYLEALNSPVSYQKPYAVGDLRLTYATPKHNIEVSFFVNNVTDKQYLQFSVDNSALSSAEWAYSRPRWMGGSASFKF